MRHKLSVVFAERASVNLHYYDCDLDKIAWSQSCCPRCGWLGSRSFRQCDCQVEIVSVGSLAESRALVEVMPKPKPKPRRVKNRSPTCDTEKASGSTTTRGTTGTGALRIRISTAALRALRQARGPLTTRELFDRAHGGTLGAVSVALYRMQAAGLIKRRGGCGRSKRGKSQWLVGL